MISYFVIESLNNVCAIGKDTGNMGIFMISGYNNSPYISFPCIGYTKYDIFLSNSSDCKKGLYLYGSADYGSTWAVIKSAGGTALSGNNIDIGGYNMLRINVNDGYGGTTTGLVGCYGYHRLYN